MTKSEWETFEDTLIKKGYKKWTIYRYGKEAFDVSKVVRDGDKDLFRLIFRFWDFEKYQEGAGYSVDFVVMPCIDGRMDAFCSSMQNGLSNNIEFAEKFAQEYYEFVINQIGK